MSHEGGWGETVSRVVSRVTVEKRRMRVCMYLGKGSRKYRKHAQCRLYLQLQHLYRDKADHDVTAVQVRGGGFWGSECQR